MQTEGTHTEETLFSECTNDCLDSEEEFVSTLGCRSIGVDLTPMVDVTFLLLIFFVVTASFQIQKSIAVNSVTDAPGTPVADLATETIELRIDELGTFQVLAYDWQAETPSKQSLVSSLRRSRIGSRDASLLVKVHEQASLQSLVDGMDAGALAGFQVTRVAQVVGFQ